MKKEQASRDLVTHAAGAVGVQKSAVDGAVADRDRAAQAAIDSIHQITSGDGLNDSWWDDWGVKITEWVAKIAEAIATIAGILALVFCWVPILGEVLMVIAAVAGIVAALANILLAATGEKSWGEAAMSVVFAVLGCIGVGGALRTLGGAAKVGAGLRAGAKAAADGAASASGGRSLLSSIKGFFGLSRPTSAGRTVFMEATDGFTINSAKSTAVDGFHDVVAHGSPQDFGATPYSWQQGKNFDAKAMADYLRADPGYAGGPIRLLSCSTGKLADGAAQQLADELGVEVLAPTDTLWAFSTGRLTVGPDAISATGTFKSFHPGGTP